MAAQHGQEGTEPGDGASSPQDAPATPVPGSTAGEAYLVRPDEGPGHGVMVLHSWWGLGPQVKRVVERLADAGYTALAPDLAGGVVTDDPEEAQRLLSDYKRKREEAEREAEAIVANARKDAEFYAADAKAKAEDFVARRTRAAEQKIALAESQAVAEVRAAAAEAAVSAAERVLAGQAKGPLSDELFDRGVSELRTKLN